MADDFLPLLGYRDGEESSDSEGEEEVANEQPSTRATADVLYDSSLPPQHTYLGTDLEELSGRTVLEDDDLLNLPLLSLPGIVLIPGQTLPLHLFQPSTVAMVKHIIDSDRTFGMVNTRYTESNYMPVLATVGTTAEIRSYKEEVDDTSGLCTIRVKAEGRQRFQIIDTRRQSDGVLMGRVRILPDLNLGDSLEGARLPCMARFSICPPNLDRVSTELDYQANQCVLRMKPSRKKEPISSPFFRLLTSAAAKGRSMKKGEEIGPRNDCNEIKLIITACVKYNRNSCAYFTWWPPWVYKQYDQELLMQKIRGELNSWNKALKLDSMPKNAAEFSYWVAASLPIDDMLRVNLLSINCAIQRLRCELNILERCTVMCCKECAVEITDKNDVFSMSVEGPQGMYVNPGGYVHETLTVYKARGLSLHGSSSTEYSWFPGYAWTIAQCRNCSNHIGWKFTARDKKLKPDKFWGLCRSSLHPGLKTDETEEDWVPCM